MKPADHLYTWRVTDRRGQTAQAYKHIQTFGFAYLSYCDI